MIKQDNAAIRKKFGENLRSLRISRGYSQVKFAEALEVTQAAVSSWETGIREPEFSIIFRIADQFKVPVSSLIPIEETELQDDMDRKALDILHQQPALYRIVEKSQFLTKRQIAAVISMIDAIAPEEGNE